MGEQPFPGSWRHYKPLKIYFWFHGKTRNCIIWAAESEPGWGQEWMSWGSVGLRSPYESEGIVQRTGAVGEGAGSYLQISEWGTAPHTCLVTKCSHDFESLPKNCTFSRVFSTFRQGIKLLMQLYSLWVYQHNRNRWVSLVMKNSWEINKVKNSATQKYCQQWKHKARRYRRPVVVQCIVVYTKVLCACIWCIGRVLASMRVPFSEPLWMQVFMLKKPETFGSF